MCLDGLSYNRCAVVSVPGSMQCDGCAVMRVRAETCRFCGAKGVVVVELGGGEKETSTCVNCEGRGSITCTTCQGTGIQPRYLDRRSAQQLPMLSGADFQAPAHG